MFCPFKIGTCVLKNYVIFETSKQIVFSHFCWSFLASLPLLFHRQWRWDRWGWFCCWRSPVFPPPCKFWRLGLLPNHRRRRRNGLEAFSTLAAHHSTDLKWTAENQQLLEKQLLGAAPSKQRRQLMVVRRESRWLGWWEEALSLVDAAVEYGAAC